MKKQGYSQVSEDGIITPFTVVLYLGTGVWLMGQDIVHLNTMNRVADGYFAVFSRGPHLTTSDLLRDPLSSLAVIPLLLFAPVVPVLAVKPLAGVVVPALCDVLTMVLTRRLLILFEMGGGAVLALTGVLVAHPLILLPAASGTSKSILLAAALYIILNLTRWSREDDPWHPVHVGVGLGLAYLARHEAVTAVAVAVVLALIVGWRRS